MGILEPPLPFAFCSSVQAFAFVAAPGVRMGGGGRRASRCAPVRSFPYFWMFLAPGPALRALNHGSGRLGGPFM
jgi:hypothetical protein